MKQLFVSSQPGTEEPRATIISVVCWDGGGVADVILRIYPDNNDALIVKGLVSSQIGELARADAFFDEVLARDIENAEAWDGKGIVAANRGNIPEALHFF